MGKPKILVVGDLLFDRAYHGRIERACPEDPTIPVFKAETSTEAPGGAGAVALLAAGLGAEVQFFTLFPTGYASPAIELLVERTDITCAIQAPVPPLAKHRFFIDGQQTGLRLDTEVDVGWTMNDGAADHLRQLVARNHITLIADYGKGTCTPEACKVICDAGRDSQRTVIVDPARNAKWIKYAGATGVKANRAEMETEAGDALPRQRQYWQAAREARERHGMKWVVVTAGPHGAVVSTGAGGWWQPAEAIDPRDVTGAGDCFFATLGVSLANGDTLQRAVRLAAAAGTMAVKEIGIPTPTMAQVEHASLEARRTGGAGRVEAD